MGYRPIRTIEDCNAHHLKLQVTCRNCGRVAVFEPHGFLAFGTVPFSLPLNRLAARLVCRGDFEQKGCGKRGANVTPIVWPPIEPIRLPPKPFAYMTPRGVDPEAWAKADERERKRLIRIARG